MKKPIELIEERNGGSLSSDSKTPSFDMEVAGVVTSRKQIHEVQIANDALLPACAMEIKNEMDTLLKPRAETMGLVGLEREVKTLTKLPSESCSDREEMVATMQTTTDAVAEKLVSENRDLKLSRKLSQ